MVGWLVVGGFNKTWNLKHFQIVYKTRDICNLNYKLPPQDILVKIHNGSIYDYYFLIKELAEEFKGQFECLGENTEKYITFSVPIKKEHDND